MFKEDGFEHNNLATYTSTSGSPAIVSSPVRTGKLAMEISASAAAENVRYNPAAGIRHMTQSVYIRFATLPTGDVDIAKFIMSTVGDGRLKFVNSSDQFGVEISAIGPVAGGPTLSVDTWYLVDIMYDTSQNPGLIRARVDGGTEFTQTRAQSAEDIAGVCLGTQGSETFTAYYDDWWVSVGSWDYPIGAHPNKAEMFQARVS